MLFDYTAGNISINRIVVVIYVHFTKVVRKWGHCKSAGRVKLPCWSSGTHISHIHGYINIYTYTYISSCCIQKTSLLWWSQMMHVWHPRQRVPFLHTRNLKHITSARLKSDKHHRQGRHDNMFFQGTHDIGANRRMSGMFKAIVVEKNPKAKPKSCPMKLWWRMIYIDACINGLFHTRTLPEMNMDNLIYKWSYLPWCWPTWWFLFLWWY